MTQLKSLFGGPTYDTDVQTVAIGQVVQLEGYDYGKYVIYNITNNKWGINYELINLRTYDFVQCNMIRPLSEKFGIGYYFDAGNLTFKTPEEIIDLFEKANLKKIREDNAAKEEQAHREQVKIIGRQRLREIIPNDAQAVLIACEQRDNSDSQTDYFACSTVRIVILGFSSHKRDLFSEMHKAATNFEETCYLSEPNGEYEHREKYTGGHGYYLGKSKYRGWIVEKVPINDKERFIEEYAYAAGGKENICLGKTVVIAQSIKSKKLNFSIVDYSEKAIAVFGDTKVIKDKLSALGGRFNPKLTYEREKKAGWIFSKSKTEEIEKFLELNK